MIGRVEVLYGYLVLCLWENHRLGLPGEGAQERKVKGYYSESYS